MDANTMVTEEMRTFILEWLRNTEEKTGEDRKFGIRRNQPELRQRFVERFETDIVEAVIESLIEDGFLRMESLVRVGHLLFTPEAYAEKPKDSEDLFNFHNRMQHA